MSDVKDLSPTARGAVTGAIFCTLTLPITNYRFRKSLNLPIELRLLYQAYLPTVLRDIIYGTVRTLVNDEIKKRNPTIYNTITGKFFATALAVLLSCLISAPANEMRAYTLQPPNKKKTVKEFFQPEKFVRSTTIGGTIMSFAMGTGAIATQPAQDAVSAFRTWMKNNQMDALFAMFVIHQYLEYKRRSSSNNN